MNTNWIVDAGWSKHTSEIWADRTLCSLPHSYIRPAPKLPVKPANWWLRTDMNGALTELVRPDHR
jgi:hypothetical protein